MVAVILRPIDLMDERTYLRLPSLRSANMLDELLSRLLRAWPVEDPVRLRRNHPDPRLMAVRTFCRFW